MAKNTVKIICTCCEEELDEEGIYEMEENEGYTGCCNKRAEYIDR